MPHPSVCFVDCETSGLDPRRHEPWEVALITPDGEEHVWQLDIREDRADLIALNIGRYFDEGRRVHFACRANRTDFAEEFQTLTAGLHLAGAVVSFDANMIGALMLREGYIPAWHYHLIDVEALAAGYVARSAMEGGEEFAYQPPWRSESLSMAVGVDPARFDRHTALGDAMWAKAIYEAVTG